MDQAEDLEAIDRALNEPDQDMPDDDQDMPDDDQDMPDDSYLEEVDDDQVDDESAFVQQAELEEMLKLLLIKVESNTLDFEVLQKHVRESLAAGFYSDELYKLEQEAAKIADRALEKAFKGRFEQRIADALAQSITLYTEQQIEQINEQVSKGVAVQKAAEVEKLLIENERLQAMNEDAEARNVRLAATNEQAIHKLHGALYSKGFLLFLGVILGAGLVHLTS